MCLYNSNIGSRRIALSELFTQILTGMLENNFSNEEISRMRQMFNNLQSIWQNQRSNLNTYEQRSRTIVPPFFERSVERVVINRERETRKINQLFGEVVNLTRTSLLSKVHGYISDTLRKTQPEQIAKNTVLFEQFREELDLYMRI